MKNSSPRDLNRICFPSIKDRNSFFENIRSQFDSWAAIARQFNISKTRLEFLRNGTRTMPEPLFSSFLAMLNKKEQKDFKKRIEVKEANWGRQKGGKTTIRQHPEIFKKGRELAKKRSRAHQYSFPKDMLLTPELAEFIGAFIGDGFTNSYDRVRMTQITGDAKKDYNYITEYLPKLIKTMSSNASPRIRIKDNTIRLTIYSKELHELLTKRFGFPAGKKTFTVTIPDEILKAEPNIRNACLRGIFDTDGGIIVDKRKTYKEPYIRIHLRMLSKELIKQIHNILQSQGINSRISDDKTRIQLNGKEECSKFVKKIGFNNERHRKKNYQKNRKKV